MADLIDFGGWPLLSLLEASLKEKILSAGRRLAFEDGALIHSRGDASPGLSLIVDGAVRFGLIGEAGDYIEMSLLGAGHCFGEATLFAGLPRAYDASAIGETHIRELSPAMVARLIDDEPDFAHALLRATTRRLYDALEFSHDLRRLPSYVHAAKLIASMLKGAGDPNSIAATQSDLADTLGLSRVQMGACLKRLEGEGLIRRGYGRIHVDDAARLETFLAAHDAGIA